MDKELRQFKTILRQNGHFVTRQRLDLFNLLQQSPAASVQELVAAVPPQDEATVYRNINLFERLGIVSRLQLGWQTKVELSDAFHHHHHHFTCLKCGCVIPLEEDSAVERAIAGLTARHDFRATDHQLEIRGLCHKCRESAIV